MRPPKHNGPVMVQVEESGYEPKGSQHVAFYDPVNYRWHYQDTGEEFKAPIKWWRALTNQESWNI